MESEWQSYAALAVVGLTAVIFAFNIVRKPRKSGKGCASHACGCIPKPPAPKK